MTPARKDNLPLPNLKPLTKILYSSLLLISLIFFTHTWYTILSAVYLHDSSLGIELGVLANMDLFSFRKLFLTHFISVALMILVSYKLFQKTSLRRRVKALIFVIAFVLAILDLSAWSYAPTCSSTNLYVGVSGMISALPLFFLALFPLLQMWCYKRWNSPSNTIQRVVIIGGGFAGLYAAMGLNKVLGYNKDLEITVLDKKNYFLFPPLLPSAAAGTIETRQVSYPFRRIFETTNIIFRKVEVQRIDPTKQTIYGIVETNFDPKTNKHIIKEAQFDYNYLVLAPGSITQTFNTPGAEKYSFFMRELADAISLRNHVIDCFERAATFNNIEDQQTLLRFVIVGGGPTGIETATEISDLIQHILLKRYPEIQPEIPEVQIIQSAQQILPGWDDFVVRKATKQLAKLDIKLVLAGRVSEVGPDFIRVGSEKLIPTRTVVWCAGVKPSDLLQTSQLPLHKSGRIEVTEDLSVANYKNIFVLGDAAYLLNQKTNQPLPPLGQVAFQQGSHTAKNLIRSLGGTPTLPFKYFDFGGLVSVGEHFAAVNLVGVKFSGFLGWLIWRSLYLVKIVGVSNKVKILIDWTLDLLIERSISQIHQRTFVNEATKSTYPQPPSTPLPKSA